jgi:hypothetical protein
MSLTSFLLNKDVQERFYQEFPMPRFTTKLEILAPPLSNRYSLIGTAFDYLLRFYIKNLNPDVVSYKWIAEHSISHPLSPFYQLMGYLTLHHIPTTLAPFFQEYDLAALDPQKDAHTIIERALQFADRAELRWLFDVYGQEQITAWVREFGREKLRSRTALSGRLCWM